MGLFILVSASCCFGNLPADFNGDGDVSLGDFGLFAMQWLQEESQELMNQLYSNGLDRASELDKIKWYLDKKTWGANDNFDSPYVVAIDECNDITGWLTTGVGASITLEPAGPDCGYPSLKHTVPDGITATAEKTGLSATASPWVGVYVKVDDLSKLESLRILLYEDEGDLDRYYSRQFVTISTEHNHWGLKSGEWKLIWIHRHLWYSSATTPSDWGTESNPTYPVQRLHFQVEAAGGTVNVYYGKVVTQNFPKAGIIIYFDDGYESAYNQAYPMLSEYKWAAVAAVHPSTIGIVEWCMTVDQLTEMQDAGWDICSHTWEHQSYDDSYDVALQIEKLSSAKKWLVDHNFLRGAQFMVWPGNGGDNATDNAAEISELYHIAARGSVSRPEYSNGVGANHRLGYALVGGQNSGWIPIDWMSLPFYSSYANDERLDFTVDLQGAIDQAIIEKAVLGIYFHKLTEEGTEVCENSIQFFADMLAYLEEKEQCGELEVLTLSDWYSRMY